MPGMRLAPNKCFVNGIKSREVCSCTLRAKRRRLHFKQPDVIGAFSAKSEMSVTTEAVGQQDANGHILFVINSLGLTWCNKCGSYTFTHVKDLGRICGGVPSAGKQKGLGRLRKGRHPITNEPLGSVSRRLLDG